MAMRSVAAWVLFLLPSAAFCGEAPAERAAEAAKPPNGEKTPPAAKADDLIVTQKYNLAQADDTEGVRDVVQKIYLGQKRMKIEDSVETVVIDIEKETLATYRHKKKTRILETFAERRKRIEEDKEMCREDLKNIVSKEQRRKLEKLYRFLLDDDRNYKVEWPGGEGATATIAGVECRRVAVKDNDSQAVYDAYVHPDIVLPYDSADVLYLLELVSKKVADTLKTDPNLKRLPMRMSLTLTRGGELKAEVTNIEKVKAIPDKDFAAPEGYKDAYRPGKTTTPEKDPNAD